MVVICPDVQNPEEKLHVGDYPTVILITVADSIDCSALDVSGSTIRKFIFKKPDEDILEVTALFNTDGIDGKLKFTTTTDTLDQAGEWEVRAELDGQQSSTHRFTVYSRWNDELG